MVSRTLACWINRNYTPFSLFSFTGWGARNCQLYFYLLLVSFFHRNVDKQKDREQIRKHNRFKKIDQLKRRLTPKEKQV